MKKKSRKADEMEMAINVKAARNAYAFSSVALVIYSMAFLWKNGEFPDVFLIVAVSGAIFWGTKVFETNRLTKSEDLDEE